MKYTHVNVSVAIRHLAERAQGALADGRSLPPTNAELLWPSVTDDDEACEFVRAKIRDIAKTIQGTKRPPVR